MSNASHTVDSLHGSLFQAEIAFGKIRAHFAVWRARQFVFSLELLQTKAFSTENLSSFAFIFVSMPRLFQRLLPGLEQMSDLAGRMARQSHEPIDGFDRAPDAVLGNARSSRRWRSIEVHYQSETHFRTEVRKTASCVERSGDLF